MAHTTPTPLREEQEMQEHHGAGKYVVVWLALLVLTAVTVLTGRMHFHGALVVALIIAAVKGTMVALFFMHLSEHHGANRLIFAVSVLFVVVMIMGSIADPATRFRLSNSQGSTVSNQKATNFLQMQFGDAARSPQHDMGGRQEREHQGH
jgi:cytochrome c oxidase subunit IV